MSLGHGMTDNAVVSHPYLGTNRVVDDLSRLPGWDSGMVLLNSGCMIRSRGEGLCAIDPAR